MTGNRPTTLFVCVSCAPHSRASRAQIQRPPRTSLRKTGRLSRSPPPRVWSPDRTGTPARPRDRPGLRAITRPACPGQGHARARGQPVRDDAVGRPDLMSRPHPNDTAHTASPWIATPLVSLPVSTSYRSRSGSGGTRTGVWRGRWRSEPGGLGATTSEEGDEHTDDSDSGGWHHDTLAQRLSTRCPADHHSRYLHGGSGRATRPGPHGPARCPLYPARGEPPVDSLTDQARRAPARPSSGRA